MPSLYAKPKKRERLMKDEMDILREISSIAAGHGSIALSEMMGKKLNLELPSLEMIPAASVASKIQSDQVVLSVASHILSGIKGGIIFVLDEKALSNLLICAIASGLKTKKQVYLQKWAYL